MVNRNEYMKQLALELHRPVKRRFHRRQIYVHGVDDVWGADLVDMQALQDVNKGMRFLLTVIDCASRYAWAIALKDKTGESVRAAFASIFSSGRHPKRLWVDEGKEFYNRKLEGLLKDYGITMYSTGGDHKCSIIERFNRTLKTLMYRLFTQHGIKKWINMLPFLVDEYNKHVHGVIKMTPADAVSKVKAAQPAGELGRPVFQIGEVVRISKLKGIFEKGYLANWSSETFLIRGYLQRPGDPVVYYLRDLHGENIKGTFYAEELQKVKYPSKLFVDRVLARRVRKGVHEAHVRWIGFDESHNSWIPEDSIR